MLKLKKIAVTGGLAAGKTTVCQLFKELGAYVVSADEIVHQILSPGTSLGRQVISLLGPDVVSGQEFDRKKIADKVFSKPDLLLALEELIHPAVFDEIERRYHKAAQEKKYPLFIAEIPLLYESGAEDRFDAVISVYADINITRLRFKNEEEFDKRMTRQIEPKIKSDKSHFTIENNGTMQELKNSVKNLYLKITSLQQGV